MKLRDNLIKLFFILLISLKLINAQLNPQNIAPSANAEKCKERGDSVVELDNFKSTLQGYKAPLQEVRDSL